MSDAPGERRTSRPAPYRFAVAEPGSAFSHPFGGSKANPIERHPTDGGHDEGHPNDPDHRPPLA